MFSFKRLMSLMLALVLLFGCTINLAGCKKKTVIDNEETRLVLSTSELDGVFNPFYSSSGPDGSIVGMTQIGMLSSDKDGKVAYGEDEACVVLDYDFDYIYGANGAIEKTVYRFVLKNDLKFSNGSPLTMKDVLFNLYVYLDPAYYGSATIYSTDIVGLQEYRTQTTNEKEQEDFEELFNANASDRILRLTEILSDIYKANKGTSLTEDQMLTLLTEEMNLSVALDPSYATIVEDYELAKKYFSDFLTQTYTYSIGTAQDIKFRDKSGKEVCLSTDTEAFFYNLGYITWNKKEYKFEYALKDMPKDAAIDAVYQTLVPNDMLSVIGAVYLDLFTRFALLEKQAYFETLDSKITSISGIRYANRNDSVTVKNTTYGVPTFAADGSVASGNEVLGGTPTAVASCRRR